MDRETGCGPESLAATGRPAASTTRSSWSGRGLPHDTKRSGCAIAGISGPDLSRALERLARDGVHPRHARQRRHRQADRGFGQTVDGAHRVGPEAVAGEAPGEPRDRVGADRFGPVERQPPRARDPVPRSPRRRSCSRTGRRRSSAPAKSWRGERECPEPPRRAREERQGRQDHDRDPEIEGAEPGADQTHVVIERQPARGDIIRAGCPWPGRWRGCSPGRCRERGERLSDRQCSQRCTE